MNKMERKINYDYYFKNKDKINSKYQMTKETKREITKHFNDKMAWTVNMQMMM